MADTSEEQVAILRRILGLILCSRLNYHFIGNGERDVLSKELSRELDLSRDVVESELNRAMQTVRHS